MARPADGAFHPKMHKVDELHLDPHNPRLRDAGIDENSDEPAILKALWDTMAVDEVAISIANNGYYPQEPLFVAQEGRKRLVIEGNRRLAAVKLLRDTKLREQVGATSLPTISKTAIEALYEVPIVETTRRDVWSYLGFKHINGPQTWQSLSKAHYVAWVHNELGISLPDIAKHIGDQHSTVVRLYDGLMALEQADREGVYDSEDRYKKHFSFSHFYTGLGYPGIRKFLGLPVGERDLGENPVPKRHLKELGELLTWLFGRKSENIAPIVKSQNPDLRQLDEVVTKERGVIALRKGLPLGVSLEISRGDERVFREALVTAKQALQKARGTVLTGYNGNEDMYEMAKDISVLANTLLDDMAASDAPVRSRRRDGDEPSRRRKSRDQ